FLGDFSDDAELLRCGTSAIEADAQHDICILQFRVPDWSRKLATKVLLTLGINTQPLKAWGYILRWNRGEALLGVNINNALFRGKARIFLLDALIVIERFHSVNLPLPFRFGSAAWTWLFICRNGHVVPNVGGKSLRTNLSTPLSSYNIDRLVYILIQVFQGRTPH